MLPRAIETTAPTTSGTETATTAVVYRKSRGGYVGAAEEVSSLTIPLVSALRRHRLSHARGEAVRGAGRHRRAASASVPEVSPEVKLSSADRVLFPDDGVTKGDLFAYYDAVAAAIVPHL